MSDKLKLYHAVNSPNSRRVRIFQAEKGLKPTLISVDLGAGEQHAEAYRAINPRRVVPALVLEVSEDGLSVQASEPLPAAEVPLRFILPETAYLIEGSGEVTWADDSGRAGIFFSELTPAARRQLKGWLSKRDKKKLLRTRVMARTVKGRPAATPAR